MTTTIGERLKGNQMSGVRRPSRPLRRSTVSALLPNFAEDDFGSDWNDLMRSQGVDAARQQLGVAMAIAERERIVRDTSTAQDRELSPSQAVVIASALDRSQTAEIDLE